jgi:hypothetical protein
MKNQKTKPSKKIILIVAVFALLLGAAIYFWQNQSEKLSQTESDKPINTIDYSGPTDEEKEAGDLQKENNKSREETDGQTTPPSNADIVLVDAGQYENIVEVRAYVSNIYADDGNCSVKLTNGSQTITRTSEAFKDVKTTQCGTFKIDRTEFSAAGTWNLTVSYSSPTSVGSITKEITIN